MNILVTGATKGIGKAIATSLDGEVFAVGRNEEALKCYKNYFVCDFTDKEKLNALGTWIKDNNIDVLINNAGEYIYSAIEKMNYDDMEKISQVNFVAPYFLISCVVDNMKKNNFGRIINIGSISGVMGEAYASLYSATKSGLIGGTKALALELAEFGITINTINPGWVDTELGNASISDSEFSKEEILDTIPQKRFVSPSEIAGMCQYLISDNAKGVTGQSINLCAGLSVGY